MGGPNPIFRGWQCSYLEMLISAGSGVDLGLELDTEPDLNCVVKLSMEKSIGQDGFGANFNRI